MASTSVTTYDPGDQVRLTVSFLSTGSTAVNPTTVSFVYRDPAGNLTTMASSDITNDVVGTYYGDLVVSTPGVWYYRITSTGNLVSAGEDWFRVRHSQVST